MPTTVEWTGPPLDPVERLPEQDAYLISARDFGILCSVHAIEQERNSARARADAYRDVLREIAGEDGDGWMRDAAQGALRHYGELT